VNVFTCTQASGHWPVGFAAVVVAETRLEAARLLEKALVEAGLPQPIPARWMKALSLNQPVVQILHDGNY
jgi:hypothetical protein